MKRILLIGCGPHAKRIYVPIFEELMQSNEAKVVAVLELEDKEKTVRDYFMTRTSSPSLFFIKNTKQYSLFELSKETETVLTQIRSEYKIDGVVIATEPSAHVPYALWAMRSGVPVLMDKPISAVSESSVDPNAANRLWDDYSVLARAYKDAKTKNSSLCFHVVSQRRYHPVFNKAKDLINEVFTRTNCPVTSIQSFHCDGQWRTPQELIDLDYHSFNKGYGKASHSGYHFFDIVPWLMEAGESNAKAVDNIDLATFSSRPQDFVEQFTMDDYSAIFNEAVPPIPANVFDRHGEVDCFTSCSFKRGDKVMGLGSFNLAHTGFSQRGWLYSNERDLYKSNGRIRHESHIIEQGPFQAIMLHSFQGREVNAHEHDGLYDTGGEYHFDIKVFRNDQIVPEWDNYAMWSVKDLTSAAMDGLSRGHQEDARRLAVKEFVDTIYGRLAESDQTSCILSHSRAVRLMQGAYLSMAKSYSGESSCVNLEFTK